LCKERGDAMKDMYESINSVNKNAYIDLDLKDISEMEKGIYDIKIDGFQFDKVIKKVKHPLLRNITSKEMKRGIIYSEILGKPRGL
jgi:hypothetical protein